MLDRRLLDSAIQALSTNPEQFRAVYERGHCVVLAGPGSGKTKTLTTAMARALYEDIVEPRGIACITYNNECAIELEDRLSKLGITASDRVFIGTVHSFALAQIILPYARCVLHEVTAPIRIATKSEISEKKEAAYRAVIGDEGNVTDRWKFADEKRRRDVNRSAAAWRAKNPELADLIETYEARLHGEGLIDFDDMPLLALRMVQENEWIRRALRARFPVLFVDEYQDLGHALHELVLLLCFEAGIRLFAVGDIDQSIYAFLGASPELLTTIADREDVAAVRLRVNYRSGDKIVNASLGALGEHRDYASSDPDAESEIRLLAIEGDLRAQAAFVIDELVPRLKNHGIPLEQIAILYRNAKHGDIVDAAAHAADIPTVRADNNALVRRNSRISRFAEASARWITGGWKDANPPFQRLADEAIALVYGHDVSIEERLAVIDELAVFLRDSIGSPNTTNGWLRNLQRRLIDPWRRRARTVIDDDEWDAVITMIARTGGESGEDIPLTYFGGKIEGSGRLNLSTLHSAKGREFDAVILFAMNGDVIPNWGDQKTARKMREARRLFYVGVTRPRRVLYIVSQKYNESAFLDEFYQEVAKPTAATLQSEHSMHH